jgi:hypothetical protein
VRTSISLGLLYQKTLTAPSPASQPFNYTNRKCKINKLDFSWFLWRKNIGHLAHAKFIDSGLEQRTDIVAVSLNELTFFLLLETKYSGYTLRDGFYSFKIFGWQEILSKNNNNKVLYHHHQNKKEKNRKK